MSICSESLMMLGSIIVLYLAYKRSERKKPTQIHQLRNQYQKLLDPDLCIYGYGDYYISFTQNGQRVIHYYTSLSKRRYDRNQFSKDSEIQNLEEGIVIESDWKKRWGK